MNDLQTSFGLIDLITNKPFPLEFISFECNILGQFTSVTQTLIYYNDSDKKINTLISFPKSLNSSYSNLKLFINDIELEGEII